MKSMLAVIIGLALVITGAGCSPREYAPTKHISGDQEYGYIFKETTGITQYVAHQGKEVAIKFRGDSDPQAVGSLQSLGADVVYDKADGKRMVLIGKLHTKILWTPNDPHMADSQPYQEFTLRGWCIKD